MLERVPKICKRLRLGCQIVLQALRNPPVSFFRYQDIEPQHSGINSLCWAREWPYTFPSLSPFSQHNVTPNPSDVLKT